MRRFLANNRIWLVKEHQITADEKALLLEEVQALLTQTETALNALKPEDPSYSEALAASQEATSSYQKIKAKRPAAPAGAVELTQEQLEKHLSDEHEFDASEGDFVKKVVSNEEQTALANQECTARIEAQWSQIGQSNAIFGVYGEKAKLECGQWIAAHRAALIALLAREELTEIDVTDDEYWPTSMEEIQAELAAKKSGLLGRFKKTASA